MAAFQTAKRELRKRLRDIFQGLSPVAIAQQCK